MALLQWRPRRRKRAIEALAAPRESELASAPSHEVHSTRAPRSEEHAASAVSPVRVAIFGSCASRDAFEFHADLVAPPVAYFARSALASAMSPVPLRDVAATGLESAFQRRMVEHDLSCEFQEYLNTGEYDILLYDLIDERFDLLRVEGGGFATRSSEFVKAAVDLPIIERVAAASNEFYEVWEAAWAVMLERLRVGRRLDRLRVSKTFWAEAVADGGQFPPLYSADKIRRANDFLHRAYERITQDIGEQNVYAFGADDLIGAPDHKWGVSPFHFVDSYYERLARRIAGEHARGSRAL